MRFILAVLLAKLVCFVGKPFGKATNLPGELALKVCPKLFKSFKFKGKILAVTGSNGKTSTANLVAHILSQDGKSVINNAKGSNLTGGVATVLAQSCNLKGEIDADYVVLEVDERFSRLIFKDFHPDYLLVTNLFRDQLTRNGNVDVIVSILNEMIHKDTMLILNGDDPISSILAPENTNRVYYSMNKTVYSTEESLNITHDAKVCPKCFGKMNYQYYHYNHIGKFTCSHCGYTNYPSKYIADEVDFETGTFKVNGIDCSTSYKTIYNFLNTTAAIALCCEAGLEIDEVCKNASDFVIMKQRYNEFDIGGRKAIMILSKNQNPVSFDQSISYITENKGEKTVIVYVNNINHTYNKDTTWLYDISFDRLNDCIDKIICTGPRGYDLAVRLQLNNFNMDKVIIETQIENLKPIVAQTKGDIYVLTELYDANTIINAIKD